MLHVNFTNHQPINILCLGAHCDDIEIGAGGTLLNLLENYNIQSVEWVVFASNELRKKEALKSAELFLEKAAHKSIAVHAFRDGFLPFQAVALKECFEQIKQKTAPDIVFTHYRNDRHQDHRIISDLTWNTWRNHVILEYEIPKYDGDLGQPNLFVPLNEKTLENRNKIILETFSSQHGKHWFSQSGLSALARLRGIESATRFAEAFYSRKLTLSK